jgi:syndecan 4
LGSFSTGYGTNTTTCTLCPLGTYATSGGMSLSLSQTCLQCAPGKYSDKNWLSTCPGSCPSGTYSTKYGLDFLEKCSLCEPGTFSTAVGLDHQCEKCPPGSYIAWSAQTTCELCSSGKYVSSGGSNTSAVCLLCVDGTFAKFSGSSICSKCPSGTFSTSSGFTTCAKCQEGTYMSSADTTICVSCQVGTYNPKLGIGSPASYLCADESYTCLCSGYVIYGAQDKFKDPRLVQNSIQCSNAVWGDPISGVVKKCYCTPSPCLDCAAGSYMPLTSASTCLQCNPGTYLTATGSTACIDCPPYTYSTRWGATSPADCDTCKAGSVNKTSAHASCAVCSPCKKCPPGSIQTGKACQAGSVQDTINCVCKIPNTYFDGKQCIPCRKCHPLAETINSCVEGSTSDVTSCKCPTDWFGDGVAMCAACPPPCHSTQFRPGPKCSNLISNPNDIQPCKCIAGTFSYVLNPTSCTQCSSGFYQPESGAVSCIACPTGKTSTASNGIKCV